MLQTRLFRCLKRFNASQRRYKHFILGIETSCDDTGCAIVDEEGNILGEAINSQQEIHLKHGGIIPPIAQDLHRKNIENVVNTAVLNSNLTFEKINGIAVTNKPGLPLSLEIGLKYAKYLCRKYDKPLIPIHHMQAHALTARMINKIEFPFMVLLISGGHCLLAVANSVDNFVLLGETLNDAPGEAFDKIARRMKLINIPEFSKLSGGQAIELAASKCTDPLRFHLTVPMLQNRDCNFSLAGTKTQVTNHILKSEKENGLAPDEVMPHINDLCAGFLLIVTRHLCYRVQRGFAYAESKGLIPHNNKTLVVSGGAACNNFIAKGLKMVCDELGYRFVRPSRKLCTDNGVMIAWNGMEKWLANVGITKDYDTVTMEKTSPLGKSLIDDVINAQIRCKWVKLNKLNDPEEFR